MKIGIDQLELQLKKNLAPIYLLSGDEILLTQEATQTIRAAATPAGFQERQTFTVDNNFAWQDFLLAAKSLSLFSSQSLIELRIPADKFKEEAKEALLTYCEKPPSQKLLLIVTGKLDTKQQNTTWYKQIEKQGVIITLWPLEGAKLSQWIAQRLQRAGLQTDNTGIRVIYDLTEGNLLATHQAVEKLCLNFGKGKLTAAEIAATISDSSRFDIFNLVDAALMGDSKKTIAILDNLRAEDIEPTIILWALTRELRNLISMANAATNSNMEQVLMQYHVWEKRKPIIKSALTRHTLNNFYTMIQQATMIDRMIKGVNPGNVWDCLLDLCLNLADGAIIHTYPI